MKANVDYRLYLVTDSALAGGRPLADIVREGVDGGVTIVQLREKNLATKEFLERALNLKEALFGHGVPLIINDRVDIALACGAAGVHLGQDDLDCAAARGMIGADMIVGVSVSTVEEAVAAEAEGADYLGVSPVFSTPTKRDTPTPTGLEGLRMIRRAVRLPLVAIGGIHSSNAREAILAGADGVAVVSAIMADSNPRMAAMNLRRAIAICGK